MVDLSWDPLHRESWPLTGRDGAAMRRRLPDLEGLSVCIIGMHFTPETTGNAPYTAAMARALHAAGADVHVITGVPHYPQWRVHAAYRRGIRWSETDDGLRISRLRHAVPATPTLGGRARMESSFFGLALPALLGERSQVVIAISPTLSGLAAGVCGARGRPLGVLVQDLNGNGALESGLTGSIISRKIAGIEYALLNKADLIGVIAPQFGEILIANGIAKHKIVTLPNFTHIAPVAVPIAESRRRLGWDPEPYTVVHTGNMGRKQGLEVFVQAARLAEGTGRWSFVLVGDGSQRKELERLGYGVQGLHFMDPVSQADYPHVLNSADVLVVTERVGVKSMSLPSKLTSYAVAARPIVAAVEEGGITHEFLRESGAALITPAGSPRALLDALTALRYNSADSAELVAGSKVLAGRVGNSTAASRRYLEFAWALSARSLVSGGAAL